MFLILVLVVRLQAQDANYKRVNKAIYILPTQLIFPEVLLTYEHFMHDSLSLSASFGYKIPTGSGNTLEPFGSGLWAVYENQYMFNEFSHGIYGSFAASFYFDKNQTFFFSPELFYRFYWFNDKRLFFDNEVTDRFNSIRTERNHVVGLKLLIGWNRMINTSKNATLAFKFYTGLSTRYKSYTYENVDNILEDGTVIPFEIEKGSTYWPVAIQLGVKIGMAFLKGSSD